jgi:hypothetical protein
VRLSESVSSFLPSFAACIRITIMENEANRQGQS